MTCPRCHHAAHAGRACEAPITQTVYADGRGFPPGRTPGPRTLLVDVCWCVEVALHG